MKFLLGFFTARFMFRLFVIQSLSAICILTVMFLTTLASTLMSSMTREETFLGFGLVLLIPLWIAAFLVGVATLIKKWWGEDEQV
jgi:hypothetical protein